MSVERIGIQSVPHGLQPLLSGFLRSVKVFLETIQPAKLPIYTAEQLNATVAAQHAGELVRCSNGDTGSECLAYCDGVSWKVMAIGNKVSSS